MGVFDSVIARCPDCGGPIEYQSKAGDCLLREYSLWDVPAEIAADIDGDIGRCPQGHVHRIRILLRNGCVPMTIGEEE